MHFVEDALRAKGIELPEAVDTRFSYRPILKDGTGVYVAGQLAKLPGDRIVYPGIVGADVTLEQACAAARACALQALAWIKAELGSLDQVRRVLRLNGYVRAGTAGFDQMSEVINAASDTLVLAYGQNGQHVRSVLGVADLPRRASVMIDLSVVALQDH